MSMPRVRVFAILVGLSMRSVILSILLLHPSTAREIEAVAMNERDAEEAPVLKTQQGRSILDLFLQSKQLHSIALKVTNEETFGVYEVQLGELKESLSQTLAKLAKLEPLDAADQKKLRDALQKEEAEIMALAEESAHHIAGLKNVRVGQRVQEKQAKLMEQVAPAIVKQSARHYKSPEKEQK